MVAFVCVSPEKDKTVTVRRYERRTDRLAKLMGGDKLKATHEAVADSFSPDMIEEFRMRPPARLKITKEDKKNEDLPRGA